MTDQRCRRMIVSKCSCNCLDDYLTRLYHRLERLWIGYSTIATDGETWQATALAPQATAHQATVSAGLPNP